MSADEMKRMAAERALGFVESGMKLGLGTGSTAAAFVDLLGKRVAEGLQIVGVPTSEATRQQAEALGIPLTTLDAEPFLDLTIDGADEIDMGLRLIKGGGGALLREKIVATASDRMLVIADSSKLVETLGRFPLPIEVVPFGLTATLGMIEMLARDLECSGELKVRTTASGEPFRTDSGNLIVDAHFGAINDPEALDQALKLVPGVVENGLFLGLADAAVIASPEGVTVIEADYSEDEEWDLDDVPNGEEGKP
ncbi:MAG: ribose-5-phosphate isomerase RpiA [Hyphomicrobiaceae bacterium]|nr:ribose-5-phosphate isomerase RpiA [Hyphomicrobiaceae bacterium]MCC0008046.1 ribose-5-phosphate isomerase RpiA [Hyphomicrobiaceae bacterium]